MANTKTTLKRPAKVLRINYFSDAEIHNAFIGVWASPGEVKMGVGNDTFMSLTDHGISMSPGFGKKINVQGMTQDVVYGGLITDLPWPLSMIPVTPFTPFPNQVIRPPLKELLPLLRDMSLLLSALPGSGGPV